MAAGSGAGEIFSLVGRIRLDGLDQAAQRVGRLGQQFDNAAQRVGQFGERMGQVGSHVAGAGASMTANVTAPLTALGVASVSVANQTEQATGRIQAQLGLTEGQAKQLTGVAQELWANGFGENVGEVADNLALVGQNMKGLNPAELKGAAMNAMNFAQAFDEDVATSTKTANTLMHNFGISSTEAFDLMTVGMQRGGNVSQDLLDTMNEYAPQMKALGYSAEGFTATLIAGAESGAFSMDKLADTAKESFLQISSGSKTDLAALTELGLSADQVTTDIASGGAGAQKAFMAVSSALAKVPNEADRTRLAVELMGTPIEDMGPQFATFFANVDQDLKGVQGSTQRAGDALANNFGARFTSAMRQFALALEPIGVILMDLAEKALPVLTQKIEQLSNWFGSLTGTQQKWLVILGLSAAAAGPLLLIFGTMITQIAGVVRGISFLMGSMRTVSTAMQLGTRATSLWSGIMRGLTGTFNLILKAGRLLGTGLRLLVTGGINLVRFAFSGLMGSIRLLGIALRFLALTPVGLIITAITALVAIGIYVWKNWDTIRPKLVKIFNAISAGLSKAMQWAETQTKRILAAIRDFSINLFNYLKTKITNIANSIRDGIVNAFTATRNKTQQILGAIRNFAVNLFTSLKMRIDIIFRTIKNGIINTWTAIGNGTRSAVQTVFNFLINLFTSLKMRVDSIFRAIKNAMIGAWNMAKSKTVEIFTSIKTTITGKLSEIATEAGKIPGKIGKAIKDKVKNATGAMKNLAESLVTKFKKALGINSPSTVFFDMAGWIVKGLVNGLASNDLTKLGSSVFSNFAGGALKSLEAIKGFMSGGFGGNMGKGAKKAAGWIKQAMAITGVPGSWFGPLMRVADKESSFNPRSINLWDSNARAGHPSRGLFQTIPTTFAENKINGMDDIYNPIHNAVAAIRYMQERYGSVFNLPGIKGMQAGGGYEGYYKGGVFTGPSVIQVAENSHTPVEAAIPLSGRYMWPFADAIGSRIGANAGSGTDQEPIKVVIEVPVHLNGREIARAAAPELDIELARRQQRDARARGRRL